MDKAKILKSNDIKFVTFERERIAEMLPQSIYDSFKENYSTSEAVIIYSSELPENLKGLCVIMQTLGN